MKRKRDAGAGRYVMTGPGAAGPKGATGERLVIRDKKTGKTIPLKGYGAMKGEFSVRRDIDLTKPIAAQVAAKKKK